MYENDFCEYAVVKKKEGSYLAKIIAAFVLTVLIAFVTFAFLIPRYGTVGLLAVAVAAGILWYLSRFMYIECEYSQSGAYLDFSYVYSKQYRKDKLSVDLKKSAKKIAPYNGSFDSFNVSHVLDMRSSAKSPYSYMLIYDDGNGISAVLFDATEQMIDNLFHQVPSAVVRSTGFPK